MRIALWTLCGCLAVCDFCSVGAVAETIDVEVVGLADDLEKNVLAYLSIADLGKEGAEASQPVTESNVRRLHGAARNEIERALQPFGYYEPSIRSTLQRAEDDWLARYDVDPGAPTVVDRVEIRAVGDGSDEPAVREALGSATFTPGEVLQHTKYEAAKQRLFDAAYDAGFIDAVYERAQMLVRREEREADIHLSLDTGPKYYFGNVEIEQNILDPSFVSKFVRIERDEPFSSDRLIELQLALGDSGYFDNVTVDVRRAEAVDRRVPIVIHTTPRQTQEYTVGVGYGTDTGPRLSFGTELRRLNRRGHRFNADLRLSEIATTAAAEYQIPVKNVATDTLSFRGSVGTREIGDLDTDQISLGASLNDVWHGFERRLYVVAERESWTENEQPLTETVLYPGMQLTSRQAADADSLFTRKGYSWSTDIRGGSESLGHRRASCVCMSPATSSCRSRSVSGSCSARSTAQSTSTSYRGCRRRSASSRAAIGAFAVIDTKSSVRRTLRARSLAAGISSRQTSSSITYSFATMARRCSTTWATRRTSRGLI